MHTVELLAQAIPAADREPPPVTPQPGVCCITGKSSGDTIPRKKLLSSNFSDTNLLAAPDSDRVGLPAWYSWRYGYLADPTKKRKKKPEMMACWWCDGEQFKEVGKVEIRDLVLNGTSAKRWAGWVTTTYKKHGSLRSPVNGRPYGIWGFDDLLVDASNITTVAEYWRIMREAQDAGIWRTAIKTLDAPTGMIRKAGAVWQPFYRWAQTRYQSPLYHFLEYLLPSQEELKDGLF
jgi:hypothetical protein